jgi:hypothetical protein
MAAIGAFTYKKKVTLDTTSGGGNIASSLTDFPVCVAINPTSWPTAAEHEAFFGASNTSGKRVQFFASDQTTNLAYEVESYVNTSGAESAIYWVKVPTITGNSTTDVWVGYGNDPNSAAQDAATSVWDAKFSGVWHLGGNSWGSSPEAKDSTGNNNHGTNSGSTDVAGVIANGRSFNGTTDHITLTNHATLRPTKFSISLWTKRDAVTSRRALFASENAPSGYNGFTLQWNTTNALYCSIGWGTSYVEKLSSTAPTDITNPHHVAVTYDGSNVTFYYDGVADGSSAHSTDPVFDVSNFVDIGVMVQSGNHFYYQNGDIDEVRLTGGSTSADVRSADWIKAEYSSMKSTSFNGDGWLSWSAAEFGLISYPFPPTWLG